MIDILKDYLISVGMQIDKQSFSQAKSAINNVDKGLGKFADSAMGKFVKVGAGASALALAVVGAMGKFASAVAEADRQTGLLAKRLYTTKENARSLSIAMKQMNVSSIDQLRELALDPESKQQFLELKNLARSLENPKTQQAMREIRQMNHEWRKLMVRFEYFKIEVASKILEIFKQMKPTIQKIIDWFKPIASSLMQLKEDFQGALPNIIQGVRYLWQIVKPIVNIIRGLIIFAVKGWSLIFKGIKNMPQAFKNAFQIIKAVLDPIIKLFRFIEDLVVYLAGGKSYREKIFDKIPWLKNIRGDVEPNNDEDLAYAGGKAKGKKVYFRGQSIGGFKADRVRNYGTKENPVYKPYKAPIYGYNLMLSDDNVKALESIGNTIGSVANKFSISSGYEKEGHKDNSLHKYGKAIDLGFAGTTLDDQLKLIRAVLNDANVSKALLEVDAQTKNNIYNKLSAEEAKKLNYIETPSGSNHLHVETDRSATPINVTNNYNISTPDPKEIIAENKRKENISLKGRLHP